VTCREFADFLADYLSDTLSPETRTQFERHLELCANCVAYLSNYRDTIAIGKAAMAEDDAPLPTDVPEGLVKAILAARRARG
jgi:anti-sigma factor RsiW